MLAIWLKYPVYYTIIKLTEMVEQQRRGVRC